MVELLGELRSMGKTVVIATNRLEDVSQLCGPDSQNNTFIGILSGGRFVVFKTFHELRAENAEVDTAQAASANWFNELLAQLAN